MPSRQPISVEKVTTPVERKFAIVSARMKPYDPAKDPKVRKRLAEYVDKWMAYNGWTKAIEVEARAKKLFPVAPGEPNGVSDAQIGKILNEKFIDIKVYSLRNLAITLGRPPEEIFAITMGQAPSDEDEDITSFTQSYKNLPESERKYFQRRVRAMIREMNSID